MSKKIKVVITHATRWSYFQWFILGFRELKKEGKIKLKFKLSLENRLSSNLYTNRIAKRLNMIHEDSYNLNGYVIYPDNTKKYFCIDSADSPYLFYSKDLKEVDCYFKMQCPKDLDKDYFAISDKVHISWTDHELKNENGKYLVVKTKGERKECKEFFENKYKIKPLMIGPRRFSVDISYRELKKGYNNYISARNINKEKKVMCYFGNSMGPEPNYDVINPDFDSESDIMGFFKEKLFHPNEKRAKVAEIINSLGDEYDARVIKQGHSDSRGNKNQNLIVPLKDFCSFVSKFQYNFNVSGYRLSIPNRFIESFMVGTGIITDKLNVKWYLPFDKEEVIETESMGYKNDKEVNWNKVKNDLLNLKKSNPEKIISCFEEKWAPKKVALYMLEQIKKCEKK